MVSDFRVVNETNTSVTCLQRVFSDIANAKITKINAELKHTQFLRGKHL